MLSVGAREKAGVSIKHSVTACVKSHILKYVTLKVFDFSSMVFFFFLDGPDPSSVKLSVGKEAQTDPPAVLIYPHG